MDLMRFDRLNLVHSSCRVAAGVAYRGSFMASIAGIYWVPVIDGLQWFVETRECVAPDGYTYYIEEWCTGGDAP